MIKCGLCYRRIWLDSVCLLLHAMDPDTLYRQKARRASSLSLVQRRRNKSRGNRVPIQEELSSQVLVERLASLGGM